MPTPLPLSVDLRISRRLLWVGGAAYPLHNIVRVHAFIATPNRGAAMGRFVRRLLRALAVAAAVAVLLMLSDLSRSSYESSDIEPWGQAGLLLAAGYLLFAVIELLAVLFAPSVPVLAVDTAGGPSAMVTTDRRLIGQLVQTLAYALDHPETEYQVTVNALTISPRNYHLGDNINMYGGLGNTGKVTG